MKKTVLFVATMLAAAGAVQAAEQLQDETSWTTGTTNAITGAAGDTIRFNPGKTDHKGSGEYHYASLFLKSTDVSSAVAGTITADTLAFTMKDGEGDSSGKTSYNTAVLAGNSSLTIDVGTLLVGDQVKDDTTGLKGGNRGFRLSGKNNTLTIYADRIVSYTGDEFVHVRNDASSPDAEASSVANIGTAERRIGYFEGHTTWGKDDYGVAILQANEGSTINFYADEAVFDGSTNIDGGVFGSGSWGTLIVNANKLTIDGNICGTYGTITNKAGTFFLDVTTQELDAEGDVNAGSRGTGYSNHARTTIVNLKADTGTLTGDIQTFQHGNVGIYSANGLNLVGDIIGQDDGRTVLGGVLNESGEIVQTGGVINMTGNITLAETASLVVAGTLNAADTVVKLQSAAPTAAVVNSISLFTEPAPTSRFEVRPNAVANVASVTTETSDIVTLGEGSTLTVNDGKSSIGTLSSADGGTFYLTGTATASVNTLSTASGDTVTVMFDNPENTTTIGSVSGTGGTVIAEGSSTFNEQYGSAAEAAQAASRMVTSSSSGGDPIVDEIIIDESESNGSYQAKLDNEGNIDESTVVETLNTKTKRVGQTLSQNILAWRLEMNDLNKRLGELRDSEGNTGLWARVNAGTQRYKGSDNDFVMLQVGADTKVPAIWNTHVGAAFSYTKADLSYTGGDGDNEIYGLAGYASWLGDSGSFLDVIAKVAYLDSDSKIDGTQAKFDTMAYSLSAEIGHRFDVTNVVFVEPQMELSYGYVKGKTFDTKSATGIRTETTIDGTDSLIGRMGFRAGLTSPEKKGNVYVRASVLREFQGDFTMTRGDGTYSVETKDTWFEYGVGGNYNISPTTQIYADVERNTGADLSEPWRFNIGARWSF
ncbi:autotransporter outer membrane beta-barrel domain-containing protein [Sutterella parvirubra]|uniref:Outer membrane autotransporter barrel domain protein n=1 Tax=Sutterella parvirubra YIT 11816 TaxID=762967 RepID=H3KF25_9BURK|nr:autotransporter outer membrane beta-barrel domain-containing protein [Sutterella parvirubra]EHY31280.1 outer membrane autotransporter barrel domain protein [Sutterella parvirubra YIT 11816]